MFLHFEHKDACLVTQTLEHKRVEKQKAADFWIKPWILSSPTFLWIQEPDSIARFFTVNNTEKQPAQLKRGGPECVNAPLLCYSEGRKSQETHSVY